MLKLIIEDDEGRKTVVPFVREEITIGRQEGNTIRLTERNVSRRHARLLRQNGAVLVEDLGSYNGIRINGEKIQGRSQVQDGDLIQIGDYDLAIQHEGAQQPHAAPPPPPLPTPEPIAAAPSNGNGVHPVAEAAAAPAGKTDELPAIPPPVPAPRGAATSIIRVDQVETSKRELVEIDASEAPRLLVMNTELAGREFACIRSELKIGRTDDNDIAIDHRSLSRTHAKVVRENNGEWRVLDMQSANGVKVNDETYAQATLRSGDTLELGHVKFKFLAPGEEYRVPADEGAEVAAPAKPASRMGVALVGGIVVVLGCVAGAYFALRPPPGPGKPAPPPPPQVIAHAPEPPAPPPAVAPAPPPPPETPKVDPQFEFKLKQAKEAAARADFRMTVSVLGLLRQDPNLPAEMAKEVDTLLAQANGEIQAKQHIDEAQKALVAGDWKGADQHLTEADGTQAYAKEQADLRKRIDEARAREQASAAVRPKPPPPNGPDQTVLGGLSEDALTLIRKKEYRQALSKINTCIAMDAKFSRCHFLAGVTYGFLKESEKAADHYKVYLTLSPDDPSADKVRKILDDYEATKKGNK